MVVIPTRLSPEQLEQARIKKKIAEEEVTPEEYVEVKKKQIRYRPPSQPTVTPTRPAAPAPPVEPTPEPTPEPAPAPSIVAGVPPAPGQLEILAARAEKEVAEAERVREQLRQLGVPVGVEETPELAAKREELERVATRYVEMPEGREKQRFYRREYVPSYEAYEATFGTVFGIGPRELETRVERAEAAGLFTELEKEQTEAVEAVAKYEKAAAPVRAYQKRVEEIRAVSKPATLKAAEAGYEFAGEPELPVPYVRGAPGFGFAGTPRPLKEIVGRMAMTGAAIGAVPEQLGIEVARVVKPKHVAYMQPAPTPWAIAAIPEYRKKYLGAGILAAGITLPLEAKAMTPVMRPVSKVVTKPMMWGGRQVSKGMAKFAPKRLQVALKQHMATIRVRKGVPQITADGLYRDVPGGTEFRVAAKVKYVPKGETKRIAREAVRRVDRLGAEYISPDTSKVFDITRIREVPTFRQRLMRPFLGITERMPPTIRERILAKAKPVEVFQARIGKGSEWGEKAAGIGKGRMAEFARGPELTQYLGYELRKPLPYGRTFIQIPTKLPDVPPPVGITQRIFRAKAGPKILRGFRAEAEVRQIAVLPRAEAAPVIGWIERYTKPKVPLRAEVGGVLAPGRGRFAVQAAPISEMPPALLPTAVLPTVWIPVEAPTLAPVLGPIGVTAATARYPRAMISPREVAELKPVEIAKAKQRLVQIERPAEIARIRPIELGGLLPAVRAREEIVPIVGQDVRVATVQVPILKAPPVTPPRPPIMDFPQIPTYPPFIPPLRMERRRTAPIIPGFFPEVRRRGEWILASKVPLAFGVAERVGAKRAMETPARSFRVRPAGKPAVRAAAPDMPFGWGRQFRPAKSRALRGARVEKSKYAIREPEEFKGITEKGLRAIAARRGNLMPKMRRRKR